MIPTDYQQFVESTSKYIFELGIAKKDTEAICSAVIANIIASSMNNNMQKKEIISLLRIVGKQFLCEVDKHILTSEIMNKVIENEIPKSFMN
jgi:DNA-binding ferritin-like protein (Dps family)